MASLRRLISGHSLSATIFALTIFLLFAPLQGSAEGGKAKALASSIDLDLAVREARENNFSLRSLRQQLAQQEGRTAAARSRLLPQLRASANYQHLDTNRIPSFNGNRFGVEQRWNSSLTLEQAITAGGELLQGYRREALIEDAQRLGLAALENDITALVAQNFYDVLYAERRISVQDSLVRLRQELLESERRKLSVGTVSHYSVLQAEVALANSRPALIQAKNDLRVAQENFQRLLGREPGQVQPLALVGELGCPAASFDLEESLATAFNNRPDLKQLALLIEAEEAGLAVSRSDFFPKLSAYGAVGVESSPFSQRLSDRLTGWEVGIRGQWNIFDSLGTIGRVTAAEASVANARNALADRRSEVNVAVRTAYSRLIEAQELVEASKKVIEGAAESLRLAEKRQEVGTGIQLEVLDAQVQLTTAKTNEVKALRDCRVATLQLLQSMGSMERLQEFD